MPGGSSQQYTGVTLTCVPLLYRGTTPPGPNDRVQGATPMPGAQLSGPPLQSSAPLTLQLTGGGRGAVVRGAALLLTGLQPATRYNCTAAAVTATGQRSKPSLPHVFETKTRPPLAAAAATTGAGAAGANGSANTAGLAIKPSTGAAGGGSSAAGNAAAASTAAGSATAQGKAAGAATAGSAGGSASGAAASASGESTKQAPERSG
ncbi:hypothetical protein D9Q98_009943 [Chlorella vulgaris]|uniref:Uncharacterized protein n=1 Tax=Chlorella vulgaris TaxID=3077 RepID=A0A9D4YSY5_CHLVU|nr:hypothetical protein D9Q98_009943 [Chlorella vulgaris]